MSANSYAQFIYFRYAGFLSLRPSTRFIRCACVIFFLFYLCVSEPASDTQMRLFYEEHLIMFSAVVFCVTQCSLADCFTVFSMLLFTRLDILFDV